MKKFLATMVVCLVTPLAILAGEVTVQSTGSVSLAADNSYINMSVVTEAPRPADAMSLNNEATSRVFDSLNRLGIKKNEIQTQGLRLTPKYFYQEKQEPKLVGYTVAHTVQITVCKIVDTGKVLDAVIKDGANRIDSVTFGLLEDKRKDALNIARKQAVQEAIAKVDLYIAAFGLKSKELKSVQESQDVRKGYTYDISIASRTASNVEGGEIEVRVTLSTVWEVK